MSYSDVGVTYRVYDRSRAGTNSFVANLNRTKTALVGLASSYIGYRGIEAIGRGLASSAKEAMQFETQLTRVSTMLDRQTNHYLPSYKRQIEELAVKYGEGTSSLTSGAYDILSATIEPAKAMKVLETSVMSAKAGFTSAAITTSATAKTLKAYGYEAEQAYRVNEIMHASVKRGILTFEDYAANIGNVLGFAAYLKVDLEAVGATIASMTRAGLSADKSFMALKNILNQFKNPTEEARRVAEELGFTLDETSIKGGGLINIIEKLRGANARQLGVLMPSMRAIAGFAGMLKNASGVAKDYEYNLNSTTIMQDNFNKAAQDATFQSDRLSEAYKDIKRDIGEELVPVYKDFTKVLLDNRSENKRYVSDYIEGVRMTINIINKLKQLSPGYQLYNATVSLDEYLKAPDANATLQRNIKSRATKLYQEMTGESPYQTLKTHKGYKLPSFEKTYTPIRFLNPKDKELWDQLLESSRAYYKFLDMKEKQGPLPDYELWDKLLYEIPKGEDAWQDVWNASDKYFNFLDQKTQQPKIMPWETWSEPKSPTSDYEKQKINDRLTTTAKMYEQMENYGRAYKDIKIQLLDFEVEKYQKTGVDAVLIEQWKTDQIKRINEGDIKKRLSATAQMYEQMENYGRAYKDIKIQLLETEAQKYHESGIDAVLIEQWKADQIKRINEGESRNKINQTVDVLRAQEQMYSQIGRMDEDAYNVKVALIDEEVKRYRELGVREVAIKKWTQEQIRQIDIQYARDSQNLLRGAMAAFEEIEHNKMTLGQVGYQAAYSARDAWGSAFESMYVDGQHWSDAMKGFFNDVGLAFKRLAAQMVADTLWVNAVSPIFSGITSGISGMFGGVPSSAPSGRIGYSPNYSSTVSNSGVNPVIYHGGGIVGRSGGFLGYDSPALWANAPKLHSGTLGPGEFRAKLKENEHVLRPDQMDMLVGAAAGGVVDSMNRGVDRRINLHVYVHEGQNQEITREEEYLLSDERVRDIVIKLSETDGPTRRAMQQAVRK